MHTKPGCLIYAFMFLPNVMYAHLVEGSQCFHKKNELLLLVLSWRKEKGVFIDLCIAFV